MKLDTHRVDINSTINFDETITMKLDEGAAAMILNNLISMYSNPYLAALREYTSNAYDSHVEAGQTRPVEVILPTGLSPNLIIRDFGVGMSREQLIQYSQFGVSSKRDTNDQIGGFGIGSKSGLAMAPQFTVTAVKDGKRNTVIVSRREDGHPVMGMLAQQDVSDTEPNGVTITIPSSNDRIFRDAVFGQMFIGWPENSIVFKGAERPFSVYDTEKFEDLNGLGWIHRVRDRQFDDSWVGRGLVGPVLYRIKWSELQDEIPARLTQDYLSRVVLRIDNGSVDLTPSREELLYSKRTRKAILERVHEVIDRAREDYKAQIEAAPSRREAMRLAFEATNDGFPFNYTYKGSEIRIPTDSSSLLTSARVSTTDLGGYRSTTTSWTLNYYVQREIYAPIVGGIHTILVPDAGDTSSVKDNQRHDIAKLVTPYIRGKAEALGVTTGRVYVVFAELPEDELDEWFKGAFSEVVSKDVYEAESAESKKVLAAKARAARAKDKPVERRTDPLVRLVTYANEGRSYYRERGLSELDTSKKYVLFQSGDTSLSEEDSVFYDDIKTALMTQYGWNAASKDIRRLSSLLGSSDYGILLANKNWKVAKYSPTITLVPLRDALVDTVKKRAVTLTPSQRTAAYDKENRRHNWTNWFSSRLIPKINRPETREWLAHMQDSELEQRMSVYNSVYRAAQTLKIDLNTGTSGTDSAATSAGDRYPLLRGIGYIGSDTEDHIVHYINLIDGLDTAPTS